MKFKNTPLKEKIYLMLLKNLIKTLKINLKIRKKIFNFFKNKFIKKIHFQNNFLKPHKFSKPQKYIKKLDYPCKIIRNYE